MAVGQASRRFRSHFVRWAGRVRASGTEFSCRKRSGGGGKSNRWGVSDPVVLIVEDEFLLRLNAVSLIEDAGFSTLEASSADEAIHLLETRPDIRIVFTDIDMPGSMDGLRLCKAIRTRWPPVELILTSGHMTVREEDIPERGFFLPKPYDAGRLVEMLKSFRF